MSQKAENMENQGDADEVFFNLTKSFRMLSIMGQLLKDQHGEMEQEKQANLSSDIQQMALRVLSFFHDLMRKHPEEVSNFLENTILKKHSSWATKTEREKKRYVKTLFGAYAFRMAYNVIGRAAESIGSDRLLDITKRVTEAADTPAASLINISVQGWYGKHLNLEEVERVAKEWKTKNFMAFRILGQIGSTHLYLHESTREDRKKLGGILDIPITDVRVIDYKRTK